MRDVVASGHMSGLLETTLDNSMNRGSVDSYENLMNATRLEKYVDTSEGSATIELEIDDIIR